MFAAELRPIAAVCWNVWSSVETPRDLQVRVLSDKALSVSDLKLERERGTERGTDREVIFRVRKQLAKYDGQQFI